MSRLPRCFFVLGFATLVAPQARGEPSPAGDEVEADSFARVAPRFCRRGTRQGIVAVNDPIAAEVGAQVLADGGNAVDAAVAIALAMNVLEPLTSGIGGGGFMVVHLADSGETHALDFTEKAPATATPDMFVGMTFTEASRSGISVGIPGELRGLAEALDAWGTISLSDALKPAISLAYEGVPVSRFVAENADHPRTTLQPETAAIFRRPDGSPLQVGDILVQPALAHTFELIADQGPDVFYEGEIAQAIVAAQTRAIPGGAPGGMTLSDLAAYDAVVREPVLDRYRGYDIATMGPPSAGGLTMLEILEMIERFPLGRSSRYGFAAPRTTHVMIEAMRLAFADRAVWTGDDDFVHVPVEGLLSTPYIEARSSLISPAFRMATPTAGNPLPFDFAPLQSYVGEAEEEEGGETTHFSVVDADGNMVSCTVTLERFWGTGITVPAYGFLLNNKLTNFNRTPAPSPGTNNAAPEKRPRSSMTPTILLRNGEAVAALGSPGGATLINSIAQVIVNLLDHRMPPRQAILAPRISVTSAAGTVTAEPEFPQRTLNALEALGHPIGQDDEIGAVNAVFMDRYSGRQCGVGDPRRGGAVAGP